jgi:poly-beta-1,6-N-acetyl-D-glucosamine synthase
MLIFIQLLFGIGLIYFIFILSFYLGWNKISSFQKGKTCPSELFISLIIAYRNEEHNLPALINSISNQTLNRDFFEIILINDNSTDNSWLVANHQIKNLKFVHNLSLEGKIGKKEALLKAILFAKGKLIVTTDADCTHHPEWLETIYSFYLQTRPKMIIGPVLMNGRNTFENFQSIDFFSLIASGAGACGLKKPIMSNGANLAFEKDIFTEFSDPFQKSYLSGDDVFLLHNIKKKYPGSISFLKSKTAIVETKPESTLNEFLKQRRRWVSKSKGFKDQDTIMTAVIVLFANLALLVNIFLIFFSPPNKWIIIMQFIMKFLVDYILLNKVLGYYNKKRLLKYFIVAELLNILLVPYIALSSIIRNISWKGRLLN